MKIIVTGAPRTGTHSLRIALDQLGFGKCYHIEELMKSPDDFIYFKNAAKNKPVVWEDIFNEFNSVFVFITKKKLDSSILNYYKDVKIIHTIREPTSWYNSMTQTIFANPIKIRQRLKLLLKYPFSRKLQKQFQIAIFSRNQLKVLFGNNWKDRSAVIEAYERYNLFIINSVTKDRILIYNTESGWKPLCQFLNQNIPEIEFPHVNSTYEYIRKVNSILD